MDRCTTEIESKFHSRNAPCDEAGASSESHRGGSCERRRIQRSDGFLQCTNRRNRSGGNAAGGTAVGDNDTPLAGPAEVVDLDDGDTPQASSPGANDTARKGISPVGVAAGGGGILAALGAAYAYFRRRNEYEYEDDDE